MSGAAPLSRVPPAVIDRASFSSTLALVAVRVRAAETSAALRALRDALLDIARVKQVVTPPDAADARLVLLNPSFALSAAVDGGGGGARGAADADAAALLTGGSERGAAEAVRAFLARVPGATLERFTLPLGYEHMSAEDVLRRLLPADVLGAAAEVQRGFEVVGHIAHINLRDELRPYGALIGAVLLDKNAGSIRTVVNKVAAIESVFRTFPMELLAGESDTRVDVRHCGARFRFDFRDVYWNSKLQYEHALLVDEVIHRGATVADACAGVGPFAVPLAAAPRRCTVHANDLNPASHAALVDAIARNDVSGAVTPYCSDARAFLASLGACGTEFQEAIMNLPASALEMCDVFVGFSRRRLLGGGGGAEAPNGESAPRPPLPRVHVYTFARAATEGGLADDAVSRLLSVLGLDAPDACAQSAAMAERAALTPAARAVVDAAVRGAHLPHIVTPLVIATRATHIPDLLVRDIRNVAPSKHMLCVSFTVPSAVAYADCSWEWDGKPVEPLRTAAAGVSTSHANKAKKRGRGEEDTAEVTN